MAFWRLSNGFGTTNPIDQILESANPNLQDLLKEHNLLHDLTSSNTKLIEYLRSPDVLKQLVQYIIDVQPVQIDSNDTLLASTAPSAKNDIGSESSSQTKSTKSNADTPSEKDDSSEKSDKKDNDEDGDVVMEDRNDSKTSEPLDHDKTELNSKKNNETSNENDDSDDSNDIDVDNDDHDEYFLKPVKSHELESDKVESQNRFQDAYRGDTIDEDFEADEYNDDQDGQYLNESDAAQQNAHVASEILAADVWSITESFMAQPELLQKLWDMLEYYPPLSMPFTTYFTKVNESLLDRVTNEMLAFIKTQKNFVKNFTKHIDNPPLMDFLLKIISSDKPDYPTGVIDFLQQQSLIPSFISFLGPKTASSVQSAAGDFLKAFVAISANSNSDNTTIGPNELSRELVSEPCVKELVRLMLYGGTGLATGVGVVIEIIRKNNSDYDEVSVMQTTLETHPPSTRDPICLAPLVNIFAENIPNFHKMLIRKHDEILKTPFGQIEPLGFERFKICELVAELLHCSNMALLNSKEGAEIVEIRDRERRKLKGSFNAQENYKDVDAGTIIEEESNAPKKVESSESLSESTTHVVSKEVGKDEDCDEENVEDNVKAEESKELKDSKKPDPIKVDEEKDANESKDIEEKFQDLNINEPQQSPTESPDGVFPTIENFRQEPVVGDKLKIALYENEVIIYILNMFFRFPWNNFLHNVVFDIVQQVLNGPMTNGFNRYLAIDLFDRGRITFLICDGQKLCAEYQKNHKTRLGYMGHLTLISEEVVKLSSVISPAAISPIVKQAVETEEWQFYENETLVRTREKYNTVLGGTSSGDELEPLVNDSIILRNEDNTIELDEEEGPEECEDDNLQEKSELEIAREVESELRARIGLPESDDEGDESEEPLIKSHGQSGDNSDDTAPSLNSEEEESNADNFNMSFYQKILDKGSSDPSGNTNKTAASGSGTDSEGKDKQASSDHSPVLFFGSGQHDSDDEDGESQQDKKEGPKMTFEEEDEEEEEEDDGLGLVRSKSHHELNWDADEVQKMINQYDNFQKY